VSGKQWSISTVRMTVTFVSEGAPCPGAEPPTEPPYVLIARPDGGDPIRVDPDDAELLIWALKRLRQRDSCRPTVP